MANLSTTSEAFAVWLKKKKACEEVRIWATGKSLAEMWATCERGDWMEWLLDNCGYKWTAQAWAEYERVRAQAFATYGRMGAQAIRSILGNPFDEYAGIREADAQQAEEQEEREELNP